VEQCAGFAGFQCSAGECIDNPNDDCDPERGGADCGGICILSCGFSANRSCDASEACVDNPFDNCNPTRDVDCGGICLPR
jgi:hypothetical protein